MVQLHVSWCWTASKLIPLYHATLCCFKSCDSPSSSRVAWVNNFSCSFPSCTLQPLAVVKKQLLKFLKYMKDVGSSTITRVGYCEPASYLWGESTSKQRAMSQWRYKGQSTQCMCFIFYVSGFFCLQVKITAKIQYPICHSRLEIISASFCIGFVYTRHVKLPYILNVYKNVYAHVCVHVPYICICFSILVAVRDVIFQLSVTMEISEICDLKYAVLSWSSRTFSSI